MEGYSLTQNVNQNSKNMNKFRQFDAETPQNVHYLYKVYDNLGCLLYVGVSDDPRRRFKYHDKYAVWRNEYVYGEIRGYQTRTAVLEAEVQSIFHE